MRNWVGVSFSFPHMWKPKHNKQKAPDWKGGVRTFKMMPRAPNSAEGEHTCKTPARPYFDPGQPECSFYFWLLNKTSFRLIFLCIIFICNNSKRPMIAAAGFYTIVLAPIDRERRLVLLDPCGTFAETGKACTERNIVKMNVLKISVSDKKNIDKY